ncbi:MAG TPA: methylated-DNA--[protein]-cysteine S-methyltransferase [Anaerolineae bacterium]|nr:methylated-DNA--[protein]-cysteine S-methyltransferase [Anaerolineae bacterium]
METLKTQADELIAMLLHDAEPSPQLKRWLETDAGRRELEAYRKALEMLDRAYAHAPAAPLKPLVYYTALRTPVGRLLIAATEAGLVRISFRQDEAAFVAELRRQLKADVVKSAEKLASIIAQLENYFAGKQRAFDLPIDWSRIAPFQRSVLTAALNIPAGQVVSYGEIARRIGRPAASRAVGQALGHNPMPIVIPCHRVVASGGGLGGYTGGLRVKQKLLQLEGVFRGA